MVQTKLILMRAGKTQNDLVISESLLVKAFASGVFQNAPIVYNKDGSYKDYRNDEATEDYFSDKVVGFVIPGTVMYSNDKKAVLCEAWVEEEFGGKTCYDNWQITLDDDTDGTKKITAYTCEFFNEKEKNNEA